MRYLVLLAVGCLVVTGMVGNAAGAGLELMAEDECRCSPLVANGVIPDAWNQLAMMLTFSELNHAIDEVAIDLKALVDQFGLNGGNTVASASVPPSLEKTEALSTQQKAQKQAALKKPSAKRKPGRIKNIPKPPAS
jgi:hypothetical protein